MQLCRRTDHVETRSPPYVTGIVAAVSAFGIARYNPDGSLDASFGSGGKVITDATPSFDGAFDVAVTSTNKIVVAGGTGFFPFGASDFLLLRYKAGGSLDTSFGSGGIVTTDFGASDTAFAVALAADGKIVAAGSTKAGAPPGDFAVARYDPGGSPDASFGSGGHVTTDVASGSDDTGNGVVVQGDRITVAGIKGATGSTAFAVVRYTGTGSLDADFGRGGVATATFGNPINNAFDIAAQPDGKVVVAGGTGDFSRGVTDFALARFLGAPTAITVSVDVKPESPDNVIPLQSGGVISVAILTTDAFDAASVDPATVCFVKDCTEKHGTGHLEDVNGNGRADLLLHYETQETGIAPGDTQACITGKTTSGIAIQGCDRIVTR